jgi:hypothetical protein
MEAEMASKQVIDRERSSRTVVAVLEEHGPQAGKGAKAALDPLVRPGERALDVSGLVRSVARMLDRVTVALIDADRAHERELAGDSQARAVRDQAQRTVFELVVAVRNIVEANFGDVGLKTFGLWDRCPNDPQGTLSYARNFAAVLRDGNVALPAPRTRNVRFDRDALGSELGDAVSALHKSIGSVAREESAAKGTQAKKDAAMAAHDRAFRIATSLGTAVFQLGGLDDLADRIKPSTRRPGTLDRPQPGDEGDPGSESDSEPIVPAPVPPDA